MGFLVVQSVCAPFAAGGYSGVMVTGLVERARSLAAQHLADLPRRWAHVQGVAAVAMEVAPVLDPVNAVAIVAACWLHDVGYAPELAEAGFHPLDGARFAEAEGFPALVVSLIAYHTGSMFEAEQRGELGLLANFRVPPAEVLDVVTFADMTTSPDGESISAEDRLAEILSRYPEEDPVHSAVSRSGPELLASVARVQDRLLTAHFSRV